MKTKNKIISSFLIFSLLLPNISFASDLDFLSKDLETELDIVTETQIESVSFTGIIDQLVSLEKAFRDIDSDLENIDFDNYVLSGSDYNYDTKKDLDKSLEEDIKKKQIEENEKRLERSRLALEEFKKKEFEFIFENNFNFEKEDLDIIDTSRKLNLYKKVKEKIKIKKNSIKIKTDRIGARIITLEETINSIDSDIEKLKEKINNTNHKIVKLKEKISDSEKNIEKTKAIVLENRKVLIDYIIHIYKKGDIVYSNGDIDSLRTIFLTSGSLGDVLSEIHFKSILEITGQKLIDKHRKYIRKLFVEKISLKNKKTDLQKLIKDQIIERKNLSDKKYYKEKILSITKGREKAFEEFLEEKTKLEKTVRSKLIKEKIKYSNYKKEILKKYDCNDFKINMTSTGKIELTKKDTAKESRKDKIRKFLLENNISSDNYLKDDKQDHCESLHNIIIAESKISELKEDKSGNVFSWPVDPVDGLSSYYHDPDYLNYFASEHEAIDIIVAQGTEIKAPADGYVVHINHPIDENYAYIALKHAGGIVSVYGHINKSFVKKYDYVKAGDVFALSGGEPATIGAGFLSTGPHLHFEVIKDKTYRDPLNFLNLTNLSLENIPSDKYVYKYYIDYKAKYGVDKKSLLVEKSKIFSIEGETEIERQRNMLNRYATPAFRNWNIWVEEAFEGDIDPSFLMCIGLAETGLGNHLKTAYNVGNIGNTDSGSTWTFTNPRNGIYWMVNTLNNRYLGEYESIDMLSRYGNKDGAIYASSPDHWHNNVSKCLTSLKREYIPDDYKFRLK